MFYPDFMDQAAKELGGDVFVLPSSVHEVLILPDDGNMTDTMLNRVTLNWKRGKRTHVFIDEFHVVFENEYSGNFFNSAWR